MVWEQTTLPSLLSCTICKNTSLITVRILQKKKKLLPSVFRRAVSPWHFKEEGGKKLASLFLDWWMLTGKTLWQTMWLNQLQRAYRTLSVMEQPHTDTLIEIQTESTMTNRLPISSSVCRQPSTRSKGCPETLRDSLNHVCWSFSRNTDACSFSLPYDVPWEVRKQQHFS